MIGRCLHRTCNRRRAFTMVEVLLTLALLVILAAMAWPALDRPFAGVRLRKAAERIRAEWATARVEAMDSGEICLFRCTADGDRYRVDCYATLTADQNATLGSVLDDSARGSGNTSTLPEVIEDRLPEGVTFVAGETQQDTRTALIASQVAQAATGEFNWSDPILFYPDGTTSTARLVLKNEHDRYIEIMLRGLTGAISISQARGSEELMP
jgi:prepilin-type N-terminal cleavage/methylation domain-containing protein